MSRIRVLIADDEPPARSKVRRFLEEDPDVEIVGEAGSGAEAIERVEETGPDVLFLDVQMPPPDGFGVLETLRQAGVGLPHVVFVTAFDEYAIRAFEVHALDYLLKPFDLSRFQRALLRAKAAVASRRASDADERLRSLLEEVRPRQPHLDRILVRRRGKALLLRVADVDWIEAARNYVTLHAQGESYLVRGSIADFEQRLDPSKFARIHRSHIVNLDRVVELHPWSHGDWLVVLADGKRLMLSRRFRDRIAGLSAG